MDAASPRFSHVNLDENTAFLYSAQDMQDTSIELMKIFVRVICNLVVKVNSSYLCVWLSTR